MAAPKLVIGGGGEAELNDVDIQKKTAKSQIMIFHQVPKTGRRIGFFDLRSKVPML